MSLYNKLCHALEDNDIDELGLLHAIPDVKDLPSESEKYYPVVVVEGKLGIELSTLSTLLKETHVHFLELSKENKQEIEQVTRVMILLKPDNYTAMNRRKELILSGHVDPNKELSLIELIFTLPRNSKSSVAWYHREWIFTNCDVHLNPKNEFSLCSKTSALYPRNYYVWTYRHWILERNKYSTELVNEEYSNACAWSATNISDFSGFQYLQQVMKLLPDLQYKQHMEWLNDLIIQYPGHESLWCHRRYCSSLFHQSDEYSKDQHAFVADILNNRFKNEALSDNPKDIINQKEFALKFGLWYLYMGKQNQIPVDKHLLELYSEVSPIPDLLDQQGLSL